VVIFRCRKRYGDIVNAKDGLERAASEKDNVRSKPTPEKFLIFSAPVQFPDNGHGFLYA
jgi:hypothetical protein